jgi:N-acyl homoserine lactone hydrolase
VLRGRTHPQVLTTGISWPQVAAALINATKKATNMTNTSAKLVTTQQTSSGARRRCGLATCAVKRGSRDLVLAGIVTTAVMAASVGCAASSHATRPAALGVPRSSAEMEALIDRPGPVEIETVVGADWAVSRAGLINLDAPAAKAAHLTDGDEAIQIFVHVLRHPTRGTFLVDTGVTRQLVEDPGHAGVSWVVKKAMHIEKLKLRTDTATLLGREPPLAGVLLTHLHLDHVSGMRDVPRGTPIYAGPRETTARAFQNLFAQGTIDNMLAGQDPINAWRFGSDTSGRFAGVLDLFADGTVFAILVPGHTAGSVAYVVRTPKGPVLLTGDTCHTRWGWDHGVEPGSFSSDRAENAVSLANLRALVARHPSIDVRLGHQELKPATTGVAMLPAVRSVQAPLAYY